MNGNPWTDEEIGFVQDHPDWSGQRIAEVLDRHTASSVWNIRRKLRRGWAPVQEAWTADEDQVLLENPWLTAQQLSKRLLGRTAIAVQRRRQILGVVAPAGTKDPTHIGGRPLIAKTCLSCGKILQADWFQFHGGRRFWFPSCKRCTNDATQAKNAMAGYPYKKTKERQTALVAEHRARMHALTSQRATRHGHPWTDKDHAILSDPDLTLLQKALRLGRTHNAAASMCQKSGYRSHIGLGEPTDEWRIDNPNEPERIAA